MDFFGGLGSLFSIGAGLFGDGGQQNPSQSQSMSGWQALPKEAQDAYLKTYLPAALKYFNGPNNPATQQALNSYGGGLTSLTQELPGYRAIFDQNTVQPTLDEMQRQSDIQRNIINSQAARSGLGGVLNSNTAIQLGENQRNTDQLKAQTLATFNRENTTNALNLRGQTLSELMFAGDQDYNKLSRFGSLLGAFPTGSTSTSTGASTQPPNYWDKAAGAVNALPKVFQQWGW